MPESYKCSLQSGREAEHFAEMERSRAPIRESSESFIESLQLDFSPTGWRNFGLGCLGIAGSATIGYLVSNYLINL